MKPHPALSTSRDRFIQSGRHLRRARKLYIHFARHAINSDGSSRTINLCAERMLKAGLYAKLATLKDIRHGILRYMFRIDKDLYPGWDGWFRWCNDHQWERGTYSNYWTKAATKQASAA